MKIKLFQLDQRIQHIPVHRRSKFHPILMIRSIQMEFHSILTLDGSDYGHFSTNHWKSIKNWERFLKDFCNTRTCKEIRNKKKKKIIFFFCFREEDEAERKAHGPFWWMRRAQRPSGSSEADGSGVSSSSSSSFDFYFFTKIFSALLRAPRTQRQADCDYRLDGMPWPYVFFTVDTRRSR